MSEVKVVARVRGNSDDGSREDGGGLSSRRGRRERGGGRERGRERGSGGGSGSRGGRSESGSGLGRRRLGGRRRHDGPRWRRDDRQPRPSHLLRRRHDPLLLHPLDQRPFVRRLPSLPRNVQGTPPLLVHRRRVRPRLQQEAKAPRVSLRCVHQRRRSTVRSTVDVCACLQEHGDDRGPADTRCTHEGGGAVAVGCVDGCPRLQQQRHHLRLPRTHCL